MNYFANCFAFDPTRWVERCAEWHREAPGNIMEVAFGGNFKKNAGGGQIPALISAIDGV